MPDDTDRHNPDNPLGYIYWRDEVLQVMYWMMGEGFGQDFAVSDLRKFLDADDDLLAKTLERMIADALLERAGDTRYSLSELGKEEGGRRFADEFEEMTKPGHFECDEPDCDCHTAEAAGGACKNLLPANSSDHVH